VLDLQQVKTKNMKTQEGNFLKDLSDRLDLRNINGHQSQQDGSLAGILPELNPVLFFMRQH
jgi:hypothetical protein